MKKLACLFLIIFVISCDPGHTQFNDNPIIAHRGAWKKAKHPENSIASLKEAIKQEYHGAEFDVHLTKDDSLVVNHDSDFFGIDIEKATYQELLAKKLSNGENIPTVREYLLTGMKQNRTKLILEIKTSKQGKERSLKLTRMAVDLVKNLNAQKWVEYISFDYDVGKLVHQLDPEAKVAYLKGNVAPGPAKKDGYTGLDYNFKVYKKHPNWIKKAQDLGLTINAWTVNDAEEMKNLLRQDVEYITTDEPGMLMEVLNKRKP